MFSSVMVTEILGLLIVVGALLVFLMRYLARRQSQPLADQQEVQQSTVRFKEELERSGDAIVARLGNHVSHLEELIREADAKSALLEAKLAEQRHLEMELADMEKSLRLTLEQARIGRQRAEAAHSFSEPIRVDARDFASVLQNSIEREPVTETGYVQVPEEPEAKPVAEAVSPAGKADEAPAPSSGENQAMALEDAMKQMGRQPEPEAPRTELKSGKQNPGTAAAKARAMLLSGYSIEEASRDTGLGIRAVELIREMNRREIEG